MYHRLVRGSLAATLAVSLLVLAAPRHAAAYENEPIGFGKATFGTSVADFRKLFPKAKLTHHTDPQASEGIAAFSLEGQSILGLEPCSTQFTFAGGRLYQITFHCKQGEEVMKALRKKYGEPTMDRGSFGLFWYGQKTAISLNPNTHVFAFIDRARNQDVQRQLLAEALSGGVKARTRTPSSAPTPAPTSAAKP